MKKFEIVISLIIDGKYVDNSDIQIGFYNTFEEAKMVCDKIDFQTPSMYELYINEYCDDELVNDTRIK